MAIEFNAQEQKIDFGTSANVYGLTQKSMSFWVYLDSITSDGNLYYAASLYTDTTPNSDEGWGILFNYDGDGDMLFSEAFDTQDGIWTIPTSTFSTSSWYHIIITMDNSSDANNPSAYVNNVSKSFTEDLAPSGSAKAGTGGSLRVGDPFSAATQYRVIDGKLQDIRIYNRILSASEIAELYNSRCQRVVMDGLVFWAPMDGAAGLSSFDGATLSSANTIIDRISGVQGVPSGSPIGRGNTIQRIY